MHATPAPAWSDRTLPAAPGGRPLARWALACVLLAAVYGASARFGLAYSSLAPNVTLIWAPTGIGLFAVLRWGPRMLPGLVIGDFIANAGTGASAGVVLGIALGNLAQAAGCAWALRRVGFHAALDRVRDGVALMALGTAGAAVSATIGPAALAAGGAFPWAAYPSVWLQWLMGDATGVIVLTPLLLAWAARPVGQLSPLRTVEAVALTVALGVLCLAVFGDAGGAPGYYPASLALFPLVIWSALRFGLRGATAVTLGVALAAVWGTVHGLGPFVDGAQTRSLLRWWLFANVITVTSLLLAASQRERDHARAEAIRDRDFSSAILDAEGALVVVLDAEGRIQRVNRTLETLTGFAGATLVGRDFGEALITPEHRGKVLAHAEMLRVNVSSQARHDSLLRRRGAPPVLVSWTTSPLREADGRIAHVIVSGVDVSARAEAAAALRQARRQLESRVEERTRALADAAADLQVQMSERQRLEGELIRVAEREQQRIGQELHDGLGQHLTAAAIQAELLARDLEAGGGGPMQHAAERVEAMLSDAVSQTRQLARGLVPVEIEDGGLREALRQLGEKTARLTRRACKLDCPAPVEVSDHAAATQLYRIAQEAVNNALKHAPGGSIAIALRDEEDAVVLEVVNDRVPVSPAARDGDGIGLRIARHRARLIGAELRAGAQGEVWRVRVRWSGGAA